MANQSPFVYFDMGNVLVDFDHEIASRNLAQLSGASVEHVHQVVFTNGLQEQYETGLITEGEFLEQLASDLKASLTWEAVSEAISNIFTPNASILQVIKSLEQRGIEFGILSNTCAAHWNWLRNKGWAQLHCAYQQFVLSYEVQSMKPDAAIYESAESRADRHPSFLFFVDDKEANVEAAEKRGWTTYKYGNSQGLQDRIEDWLTGF